MATSPLGPGPADALGRANFRHFLLDRRQDIPGIQDMNKDPPENATQDRARGFCVWHEMDTRATNAYMNNTIAFCEDEAGIFCVSPGTEHKQPAAENVCWEFRFHN